MNEIAPTTKKVILKLLRELAKKIIYRFATLDHVSRENAFHMPQLCHVQVLRVLFRLFQKTVKDFSVSSQST